MYTVNREINTNLQTAKMKRITAFRWQGIEDSFCKPGLVMNLEKITVVID